ncbi:MAG: T9SS type A sorting domain-containing protein [Ignavibacteriales bacterium]|nr:T9SS type A sorting domain-containing protein [Ignavibacteriales bacterium]
MTRNLSASSMNKNILPPLPPEGSFDVRFQPQSNNSFGGMLEDFSFPEGKRKDLYLMISSESYPLDFSWQPKMNYDKRITLYEVVDGKDGRSHDLSAATEFQINNVDIKLLHLVIDGVDRLPLKFQLSQNHPNPFNPTTIIKFNLPVASIVILKIYNIVGNEVNTLIDDQTFESGEINIQFNGDNLASGTYFYRLSAKPKINDNNQHAVYTEIKKMILLK